MEAVAIATATNAVKNSTNISNINSNSSSSSSSGYGSATTTPLSHYETTPQHATTTAATAEAASPPTPPPPLQSQQPPTAQTVATVAPYAYSSDSVLAADTQQQQQQQQRQHYQYTTSPYSYQPAAPAASLQTLYSQHDPYVGLNYAQHATATLDYNNSADLALRERLQHNSNNNYINNNTAHSPIEKLAAYANLTASSTQHVAGNTPYKHPTDATASNNASSEAAAASTPSTKPQATATPFYATARAPVVPSVASYYEQYKFKMPTTAVAAAAADYTNYGCRVPPSTATSYQQQQQQYYAAVKSQLTQSEANYVAASKTSLSPTAGSVSRQQMNSFYGRANLYYDKFSSAAYPPTPSTATTNLTNLTVANPATYPVTHPTSPHYVTENALPSPESYRKSTVAPPPPASSWHWNMDYPSAATGNCRTLPPPLTSSIPTAAIPPSNTNSSFLSPVGSSSTSTRDVFYNNVGSSGSSSSSKYDKYNAYAYHQQQQQQATALPQRNMWSTATHERLPHVSPHSTYPTHQPLPPPPYPPHPYATQTRQNCCSQLPYQHQQQPQQNCYYTRLPPQHVASNAYPQQHPHHMQQQLATQHYSSNKYASNIYAADYPQNKLKYPNDLMATSPYDAATYSGYNYAAAATTQRYQQATQQHHNIASDAAAAAAYYNDLNLQSTAYESYATTVQQQQTQQQHQQQQQQQHHHLQQQPQHAQPRPQQHLTYHQQPSSSHHVKNPLLDYRKPNSSSLASPAATPVMPSVAEADFYMHESANVAATYHNFDSVSNVSLYETGTSVGDSVVDKLNAANKNLSLRDFLATWNDDEDDAAAAAAELNFPEPPSATPAENQVTILQNETIPAMPITAHYLQETPAPTQSPTLESHQQFKGALNVPPKIHVGIAVDSNMEAQYINLPDIVIDIEKSNNVANAANVVAATHFEDFDVEKELDELQIKRSKLSNEQHNVADYSTLNVATTDATNLQEIGSYQSMLNKAEPQHATLPADTEKSRNDLEEVEQQQDALSIQEDAAAAAPTKEQLSKDLECDNSSLSNESTFEKEYETFINRLGSDVEAPSREKFREASVIMSSASLIAEAKDLSITQIKNAQPETDANDESQRKDSNNTAEQHRYSKFYKRKRKLIDDVPANVVETAKEEEQNPLECSDVSAVAVEKSPPSEQQNFPLAYTKTCRKRKLLTATCVRNMVGNKRTKHDARRCNIVAKAKIFLTRRRKPKSLYYKMLHQSSLKKLHARRRLLQHVAKLRERHLPLIKRQSIKRFAAANNAQRPPAFNPQTLKCLSVSTLNTEHFRQHFLSMLIDSKLQKKRFSNVANAEVDVAINKTAAEDLIMNKLDEDKPSELENPSKSISNEADKNEAINNDKDLEKDVPKRETQKTDMPKTDIQENAREDETEIIFTDKICVPMHAENYKIPKNDQHVAEENLTLKNTDDVCHPAKYNETEIIAAHAEEKACEKLDLIETDINIDDIQNYKTQSNDLRKSFSELYAVNVNREQKNVNECKDDIDGVQNKFAGSNDDINDTNNKNIDALIRNQETENALKNNNSRTDNEKTQSQQDDEKIDLNDDVTEKEAHNDEKMYVADINTDADDVNNTEDDSDDEDDDGNSSDNEESNDSDSEESSADECNNKAKTADHRENSNQKDINKTENLIELEENNESKSRTDRFHNNNNSITTTNDANVTTISNNIKENDMKNKEEPKNSKEEINNSSKSDLRGQENEIVVKEIDNKHEETIIMKVENYVHEKNSDATHAVIKSPENSFDDHQNFLLKTDSVKLDQENDVENIKENYTDDNEEFESKPNLMPNSVVKKTEVYVDKTRDLELKNTPDFSDQSQAFDNQNLSNVSLTSFENVAKELVNRSNVRGESSLSVSPRSTEQENILSEDPRSSKDANDDQHLSPDDKTVSVANDKDLFLNDSIVHDLEQVDDDHDIDDLAPKGERNQVLLNLCQVNRLVAYEDSSDNLTDDLNSEETENKTKEILASNHDQDVATTNNNVADDLDPHANENENKQMLSSSVDRDVATAYNVELIKSQNSQSDTPYDSSCFDQDVPTSDNVADDLNLEKNKPATKERLITSVERDVVSIDNDRRLKTQNLHNQTLDETSNSSSSSSSSCESNSSSSSDETTTSSSSSTSKSSNTKTTTTSEESVDDFNEMIALERELSTNYEAVKTYDETRQVDEMELKINQDAENYDFPKKITTKTITKHDIASLKKVLEGAEEETEEEEEKEKELSHKHEVIENYLEKMEKENFAIFKEKEEPTEELSHKVRVIENMMEEMDNSTIVMETVTTDELGHRNEVIEKLEKVDIKNSTILTKTATPEELNHKVAVIENYLESLERSTTMTETTIAEDLSNKDEVQIKNYLEKEANVTMMTEAAAAEELDHKVAVIENYLEKMEMETSTTATEAALADELNHKIEVIENFLEKMEMGNSTTVIVTGAEESSQKEEIIVNNLEKMENSTLLNEATAEELNRKVAVIENYLEKMENRVIFNEDEEVLVEKSITRNEVEEMLLAAFESAVKEADVLERLEGGVQLMLPCTGMEISHNDTDQFENSILANEDMNQVVNFTIPKLSDLCKNALNSSCKRSESMSDDSVVDSHQHQVNVDHNKDVSDSHQQESTQEPEQEPEQTRELSVEEALAEMYRQAGVASDPEDFDTDDNDKQAQEVLLINLEEILVSDSDNLYVLQCDINENILGVIATQTVDRSNNDNDENDEVADENDDTLSGGVNAIELIELFNASDVMDVTTNNDHTINSSNILINATKNTQALNIEYDHTPPTSPVLDPIATNADLVPANISTTTTTNTTKTLPPASIGDDVDDGEVAFQHNDVNDFYDDNDFDLPTIHHEEIVPENYKNYHKEKFLKYLHAKYVQRNITKFYHSNRIIKKYKKRHVQKLLNAMAERKRYGQ